MALLVDGGPFIREWLSVSNNFSLYIVCVLLGLFLSATVLFVLYLFQIYFFSSSENSPTYVGVMIMPLGFAALFPQHFGEFNVSLSPVSGVAILAWAFVLLNFTVYPSEKK